MMCKGSKISPKKSQKIPDTGELLNYLERQRFCRISGIAVFVVLCSFFGLLSVAWTSSTTSVGDSIGETGFSQFIEVSRLLLDKKSKFQHIQVYEAAKPYYGRVLVLDKVLQITEGDASSYNEMMAHTALFHHPNPRRVLVIGGGDGHVIAEVLKHSSVQRVDHVDLDGELVEVCKKYFPQWNKWDDPRVNLHIANGASFCEDQVAQGNVTYDVIIQDSSDPWLAGDVTIPLPSAALYTEDHLNNIHRLLDPQYGVFIFQAEMLQIPSDLDGAALWRKLSLMAGFEQCRYGSIMIGSYPTGQIGFMLCQTRKIANQEWLTVTERFKAIQTKYFHPGLLTSSFVLPLWAEKAIYGEN